MTLLIPLSRALHVWSIASCLVFSKELNVSTMCSRLYYTMRVQVPTTLYSESSEDKGENQATKW